MPATFDELRRELPGAVDALDALESQGASANEISRRLAFGFQRLAITGGGGEEIEAAIGATPGFGDRLIQEQLRGPQNVQNLLAEGFQEELATTPLQEAVRVSTAQPAFGGLPAGGPVEKGLGLAANVLEQGAFFPFSQLETLASLSGLDTGGLSPIDIPRAAISGFSQILPSAQAPIDPETGTLRAIGEGLAPQTFTQESIERQPFIAPAGRALGFVGAEAPVELAATLAGVPGAPAAARAAATTSRARRVLSTAGRGARAGAITGGATQATAEVIDTALSPFIGDLEINLGERFKRVVSTTAFSGALGGVIAPGVEALSGLAARMRSGSGRDALKRLGDTMLEGGERRSFEAAVDTIPEADADIAAGQIADSIDQARDLELEKMFGELEAEVAGLHGRRPIEAPGISSRDVAAERVLEGLPGRLDEPVPVAAGSTADTGGIPRIESGQPIVEPLEPVRGKPRSDKATAAQITRALIDGDQSLANRWFRNYVEGGDKPASKRFRISRLKGLGIEDVDGFVTATLEPFGVPDPDAILPVSGIREPGQAPDPEAALRTMERLLPEQRDGLQDLFSDLALPTRPDPRTDPEFQAQALGEAERSRLELDTYLRAVGQDPDADVRPPITTPENPPSVQPVIVRPQADVKSQPAVVRRAAEGAEGKVEMDAKPKDAQDAAQNILSAADEIKMSQVPEARGMLASAMRNWSTFRVRKLDAITQLQKRLSGQMELLGQDVTVRAKNIESDMNPAERVELSKYLQDKTNKLPDQFKPMADELRQEFNANTEDIFKRGLISEKTRDKFFDKYLRRSYFGRLLPDWHRRIPSVDKTNAIDWIRENVTEIKGKDNAQELASAIAEDMIKGREVKFSINGGRQTFSGKGSALMQRQGLPKPLRKLMGQVEDGAFNVANTIYNSKRIGLFADFFKRVDELLPDIIDFTDSFNEPKVKLRQVLKQMDITDIDDVERAIIGPIWEKDIPQNLAEDVADLYASSLYGRTLFDKYISGWKAGKVLSSQGYIRNFWGNQFNAMLGGMMPWRPSSWKFMSQSSRDIVNWVFTGKTTPRLREFIEDGFISSSWFQSEAGTAIRALARQAAPEGVKGDLKQNMWSLLDKAARNTDSTSDKVFKMYDAMDLIWKYALYNKARAPLAEGGGVRTGRIKRYADVDEGRLHHEKTNNAYSMLLGGKRRKLSRAEAAEHTRIYMHDYANLGRSWQRARRNAGFNALVNPFIAHKLESVRTHLNAVRYNPINAMASLGSVGLAASAGLAAVGASEEELRQAIEATPDYDRMPSQLNMWLPYRGDDGELQVMDLGFILPLGDVFNGFRIDKTKGDMRNVANLMGVGLGNFFLRGFVWDWQDRAGRVARDVTDPYAYSEAAMEALMPTAMLTADNIRRAASGRPTRSGRETDLKTEVLNALAFRATELDEDSFARAARGRESQERKISRMMGQVERELDPVRRRRREATLDKAIENFERWTERNEDVGLIDGVTLPIMIAKINDKLAGRDGKLSVPKRNKLERDKRTLEEQLLKFFSEGGLGE